jgi:hypothetical protein
MKYWQIAMRSALGLFASYAGCVLNSAMQKMQLHQSLNRCGGDYRLLALITPRVSIK